MLDEIKKKLLENPIYIRNILEHFEFSHIDMRSNEIRCGLDETHNRTSIRIRLTDNNKLFVKDYGRSKSYDLFTYIIKIRNVTFKDVIGYVKAELGINEYYEFQSIPEIFGGFYKQIKLRKQHKEPLKIYDESILSNYEDAFNLRFFKDHIDFETQHDFNIMYDVESQRIIIPIYDSCGNLVGIKGRANWDVSEDEQKYLYLIPCRISETLYGYYKNYSYLTDNTIYVVESEKSVLQAYSYGFRNFVALGGNSISTTQCKLLMELSPSNIIFMLDNELDMDITKNNIKKVSLYTKMFDIGIGYWDYNLDKNIPSKASPTDLGSEKLKEIIKDQIVYVRR